MAGKLKESQDDVVEKTVDEASAKDTLNAEDAVSEANVEVGNEVQQPLACGARLRAERVEQDLSTQAVAKQLRLSNKQIEALEADDFDALPEPTIVKGFIRNYAKLLKIPADSMLSAYAEMTPDAVQYAVGINSGINMKISEKKKSGNSRYLLLFILFLLGLGAWVFYQSYIQKPEIANSMTENAEAETGFDLQMPKVGEEPALPEIPAQEQPTDAQELEPLPADDNEQNTDTSTLVLPEASPENAISTDITPTDDVTTDAEAASVEAAVTPETDALDAAETIPAVVGATRLEFNAKQETWISVVNQDGKEVYNKILYEGKRDVIDVVQPLEIVVGNAHGATLIVDGKPVNLAPYTRTNVARVRLDQ